MPSAGHSLEEMLSPSWELHLKLANRYMGHLRAFEKSGVNIWEGAFEKKVLFQPKEIRDAVFK